MRANNQQPAEMDARERVGLLAGFLPPENCIPEQFYQTSLRISGVPALILAVLVDAIHIIQVGPLAFARSHPRCEAYWPTVWWFEADEPNRPFSFAWVMSALDAMTDLALPSRLDVEKWVDGETARHRVAAATGAKVVQLYPLRRANAARAEGEV